MPAEPARASMRQRDTCNDTFTTYGLERGPGLIMLAGKTSSLGVAPSGQQRGSPMAATATYATLSEAEHSAQLRKAVIVATVGTTIEWYDFFLYGTAAGLVFGKLYFPNEDPLTATLLSFT